MKTISIGTTLRITDPRVFRAQLELLYRLTARSHAAAFTLSTAFLVVLLYEGSRNALATSWWLLLNGVGFARIWLGTRLRAGEMLGWTLKQWAVVTVLGAWLSGVNWGVFLLFLSPPWGAPDYPVTVFMAAGIPAVSLLANSAILASNVGIVFPILVPYALQLMWNAASRYETLTGVAAMIYGAVFLGLGRVVNRSIVEAFRLRFRNDDLVQSLSASNTDLAGEVMAREAFEVGLREARASAEAANAAKSQFLARMSHEIRTPLNGILGMSEILRQTPLSADQREHADTIDEAGRSLLNVINDILDFSKVEANQLSLQRTDFNLRDVVERSVVILRPRAFAKGVPITIDIAPEVPKEVRGDSGRLRQILINLVGNATKFTRRGEIRILVTPLRPHGDPFDVRFEVSDTGIGIPLESQAGLFQPFVQVDESSSRAHGGTGLGLAISQQLVGLMNGEMGLHSEPEKGSTFWFSVRFDPPTRPQDVTRPAEVRGRNLAHTLRGHVLVVDDNSVNRMVTGAFLERLGCTQEEAHDGRQALALIQEKAFDLVLMDCEMPGLDGYETTSEIRRLERVMRPKLQLPIVALTASALVADRERAIACGMNEYLSKPFSMEDLHRVLSPWLAAKDGAAYPLA